MFDWLYSINSYYTLQDDKHDNENILERNVTEKQFNPESYKITDVKKLF